MIAISLSSGLFFTEKQSGGGGERHRVTNTETLRKDRERSDCEKKKACDVAVLSSGIWFICLEAWLTYRRIGVIYMMILASEKMERSLYINISG